MAVIETIEDAIKAGRMACHRCKRTLKPEDQWQGLCHICDLVICAGCLTAKDHAQIRDGMPVDTCLEEHACVMICDLWTEEEWDEHFAAEDKALNEPGYKLAFKWTGKGWMCHGPAIVFNGEHHRDGKMSRTIARDYLFNFLMHQNCNSEFAFLEGELEQVYSAGALSELAVLAKGGMKIYTVSQADLDDERRKHKNAPTN